jgi:D-alanyl-D-alanine carboxypeptidase
MSEALEAAKCEAARRGTRPFAPTPSPIASAERNAAVLPRAAARKPSFLTQLAELVNTFMGFDPATQTTLITWATSAALPDGRAPANEIARILMGELSKAAEVPTEPRP